MDGALSSGRDGRSGAGHYGPGASSGGKEVDGGGDGKEVRVREERIDEVRRNTSSMGLISKS